MWRNDSSYLPWDLNLWPYGSMLSRNIIQPAIIICAMIHHCFTNTPRDAISGDIKKPSHIATHEYTARKAVNKWSTLRELLTIFRKHISQHSSNIPALRPPNWRLLWAWTTAKTSWPQLRHDPTNPNVIKARVHNQRLRTSDVLWFQLAQR